MAGVTENRTISDRFFRKGDIVEFVTTYPGHEGQTIQGRVLWSCDESSYCAGLDVMSSVGRHQVERRSATKIASGVDYMYG